MINCKQCGGKKWYALIDEKTGIQKQDKEGRLLWKCFRNSKHIQAEEHHYPTKKDRPKPSILYFDLEVSKSQYLNYGRKVHNGYLNADDIINEYYIISWAASYVGSKRVFSGCVTPEQALNWTDKEILQPLYDLLSSADIIAGHNIDAFDLKKVNTRFIVNGISPILGKDGKKKKTIDSLKIARSHFSFESNGLDVLCQRFGIKGKDRITGKDWREVLKGNEKTLKKVNKYCIGDVKNGKALWEIFAPYAGKSENYGATKSKVGMMTLQDLYDEITDVLP